MKAFPILAVIAVVFVVLISSCSPTTVPAGNVGIIVNQYGSAKGELEEKGIGIYWTNRWTQEMHLFPTALQNVIWSSSPHEGNALDESITFQTKEGLSVNGDFGVTYDIDPKSVTQVFQKYRRGIEEITHVFLRNDVRDAMNEESSKRTVEQIYGEGKEAFMDAVTLRIQRDVNGIGLRIHKIYATGTFRLPRAVEEALNAKLEAQQQAMKAQNQVAQAEAEGRKKLALAKAEAESNRLVADSLSPALVEYYKTQKWDGHLPQVTGGATPMLDLRTSK